MLRFCVLLAMLFYDATLLFKLAMLCFIKLLLYDYFVINVAWFAV